MGLIGFPSGTILHHIKKSQTSKVMETNQILSLPNILRTTQMNNDGLQKYIFCSLCVCIEVVMEGCCLKAVGLN